MTLEVIRYIALWAGRGSGGGGGYFGYTRIATTDYARHCEDNTSAAAAAT